MHFAFLAPERAHVAFCAALDAQDVTAWEDRDHCVSSKVLVADRAACIFGDAVVGVFLGDAPLHDCVFFVVVNWCQQCGNVERRRVDHLPVYEFL